MADCAHCREKRCAGGHDCFGVARLAEKYRGKLGALHKAASIIEAEHYCRKTRLEEAVELVRMMGFKRVGLAFCIGLSKEAEEICTILESVVPEVVSVCCKCGGVPKTKFKLPQIREGFEAICNPIAQAHILNRAGTELNFAVGLCVGHDAVFAKCSEAPVVTLIAKDRVTGHNPAAAIYVRYLRKRLGH